MALPIPEDAPVMTTFILGSPYGWFSLPEDDLFGVTLRLALRPRPDPPGRTVLAQYPCPRELRDWGSRPTRARVGGHAHHRRLDPTTLPSNAKRILNYHRHARRIASIGDRDSLIESIFENIHANFDYRSQGVRYARGGCERPPGVIAGYDIFTQRPAWISEMACALSPNRIPSTKLSKIRHPTESGSAAFRPILDPYFTCKNENALLHYSCRGIDQSTATACYSIYFL
jgi:hypothetical protein